jgi:hypothetical protein
MVTVFVFDAGVPIGLNAIGFLEEVMQYLEEMDSEVFMSTQNLSEVSWKESKILRNSGCFENICSDDHKD